MGRELGVFVIKKELLKIVFDETSTDKVDQLTDNYPGSDYEVFSTRAEAEARMEQVYRGDLNNI